MTRRTIVSFAPVIAALVLLAALPATTAEMGGAVVDAAGQPIIGAEVCYMLGATTKGICVETDKQGAYDLPISHMSTIQVKASGYQHKTVTVDKSKAVIVLERAAALWVRIRDVATGRTLPESEVYLVFPAGRREGPLPANDKGVKIRTMAPGRYGVLARAKGYSQVKAVSVELAAGADKWIDIEMKAVPKKR